jgi:SAM-dependent methyltransferase
MATGRTPDVNDIAARGFATAASVYEKGRPGYPEPAIAWLAARLRLGPGASVVDVGAGTGKLTGALVALGAQVIAVEPVAQMRAVLAKRLPAVRVLEGEAEVLPLDDGSADAVTVAQAFHWFDGPRALATFHRVLKRGGRLGLVWNARDERVEWVSRITEIIDRVDTTAPRYRSGAWRGAFGATGLFSPLVTTSFLHEQRGPPDVIVARFASVSYIAALEPEARVAVLDEVRSLLATHPETRGKSELALPYRTDVFACERQG